MSARSRRAPASSFAALFASSADVGPTGRFKSYNPAALNTPSAAFVSPLSIALSRTSTALLHQQSTQGAQRTTREKHTAAHAAAESVISENVAMKISRHRSAWSIRYDIRERNSY
jgi:hypothetical protein